MGFDGYVILAILTLFFVYLLPSLIRSGQVVAEARIEDRFSGDLHIIATAGQRPKKENTYGRTYIHPPQKMEHPMNTPVARKLAAADARRVAAARAARAAAASRRAAAAKRRMLLLSVLGALTVSGWILTAMVALPWAIPAVFTALTVGAVELGRRASIAGAKADEELAQRVRDAQARAGGTPSAVNSDREPVTSTPIRSAIEPHALPAAEVSQAREPEAQNVDSSLRVDVDPAKQEATSWTPVPVPPPAYTLKAEVRRKMAEPYQEPAVKEATPVEAPASAEKVSGQTPSMPAADTEKTTEPATESLNVQEILARRRAVG